MEFNKIIKISERIISSKSPTFIIAEAGVNHGGSIDVAIKLIDLAVEAKADAVKFQAFRAEHLLLNNVQKAAYQKNISDSEETQYDMLKKLELSSSQNHILKEYCDLKDIIFLTTPFDQESLKELDQLNLAAYKISSTDVTNIPFLIKIAKKRKPIFLSTGMSYLSEIEFALKTIFQYNKDVVLLQCTANYPIKDDEANLAVIKTYDDNFDILLGYSDHSSGVGAAPFAVPMGAKVVEKHFTLNKASDGPDHAASLSPEELIEFVTTVRRVDKYMGVSIKEPSVSELENRKSLQKCLVASKDIKKGVFFTEDNIIAKRTGGEGISPINYESVVGKKSPRSYKTNEVIYID